MSLGHLLMLASGAAGLGYQIVWTQQAALWLGHEGPALLAVVAAYFGGMALGAGLLGQRLARSGRPARAYALCEAVIGLWALALMGWMPTASQALQALTGPQPTPAWQWGVAFGGSLLLLLPATAAMGATLPVLAAALRPATPATPARPAPPGEPVATRAPHTGPKAWPVASLYAANTLGALLGVLALAFWAIPALGLSRCLLLCASLNLACAAIAGRALPAGAAPAPPPPPLAAPGRHRLDALLLATGLLGIGYEVVVVRVLSQVMEDTVYTFALLLAVYLVGTALGAAALARGLRRHAVPPPWLGQRLLGLLAGACLLGGASLWGAERLHGAAAAAAGAGLPAALAVEALLATAAFALPTLVMGALFSHLATCAAAQGLGLGRALAWNTLGASLAPLAWGVGLLPWAGAKAGLLAVAAGYAALAWWAGVGGRSAATSAADPAPGPGPARRPAGAAWSAWSVWSAWWAAPAAGVAGLALAAPPLSFVTRAPGDQLLAHREGVMAAVSVTEDAEGVRRLRINNRQQEGSSHTLSADARQALLPLLLHPSPQRVLFLGLGTGMTASAALQDPRLEVTGVELLPEVAAALPLFQPAWADPGSAARLHTVVADARRHMRTDARLHDLVVADNVHPARSGTGSLYTVAHFQAVRARLAPGGLFCQWLPLHQMDRDTLRSIVAAFRQVWPQGQALLATLSLDTPTLGLLGTATGGPPALQPTPSRVRQRLSEMAHLPLPPQAVGLHDEWAVLGSVVAGPAALARLADGAPVNTDDRPVVAYHAPRSTYAPEAAPRDRLLALLSELGVAPGELLPPDQADADARLAAYRQARDQYLHAGRQVRPVTDVRQMLAQVREPLLAVLHTSADFRPAYDPLLAMAQALAARPPQDPQAARALMAQLAALQPARAEAGEWLRRPPLPRGAPPHPEKKPP